MRFSWPHWPQYGPREIDAVARVVRSQQLFAAGEVRAFEEDFAEYQGSKHAVGMGNATQGLHLALAALEIGRDDEVIVTASSWISSASCILMQNAVPVFVDIESESLGMAPQRVEEAISDRTKAIVIVHILGYPALVNQVAAIARRHGIPLVEDASHAPGASVGGVKCGTFGDLGVFSLHQRKAISTGDGGILCTDDAALAEKVRRLRSFGHSELSYNYRMTEFSAALGRIGLEKLDRENSERQAAAEYLHAAFAGDEWIRVRLARPEEIGVYYAIALEVSLTDEESTVFLESFLDDGVPMRKAFEPLNRHPHFAIPDEPPRGYPWMSPTYDGQMKGVSYHDLNFPVAYEYCYGRILELYAHPGISHSELDKFVERSRELVSAISEGTPRPGWRMNATV